MYVSLSWMDGAHIFGEQKEKESPGILTFYPLFLTLPNKLLELSTFKIY